MQGYVEITSCGFGLRARVWFSASRRRGWGLGWVGGGEGGDGVAPSIVQIVFLRLYFSTAYFFLRLGLYILYAHTS